MRKQYDKSGLCSPGRRCRGRRPGFTLIETALATVIIGTGVLAIMAAQQAYHRKNNWAQHTGTAMLLANELREMTLTLPMHDPITADTTLGAEIDEIAVTDYDDLDDFAGVVTNGFGAGVRFSPPINALRQEIADMAGWEQLVEVSNVLPQNISVADALIQPLGTTDLIRVRVTVSYQSAHANEPAALTQLSWVVGR